MQYKSVICRYLERRKIEREKRSKDKPWRRNMKKPIVVPEKLTTKESEKENQPLDDGAEDKQDDEDIAKKKPWRLNMKKPLVSLKPG